MKERLRLESYDTSENPLKHVDAIVSFTYVLVDFEKIVVVAKVVVANKLS